MAAKETIDVERLLEWAYRVQCVDRVARQAVRKPRLPSAAAGAAFMTYGCPIDHASPASLFAPKVASDAEIIHDAVLRLDEMYVDALGTVWTLERAAAIGGRILRERGLWVLDLDIGRTPLECLALAALVIIHAKAGSRPEWCEGWRDPGAARAGDRSARDSRGRKRKVREGFTPEDVAFYRAQYGCWHAALGVLAVELEDALADFTPTAPLAPKHPWLAAKGRALPSLIASAGSADRGATASDGDRRGGARKHARNPPTSPGANKQATSIR